MRHDRRKLNQHIMYGVMAMAVIVMLVVFIFMYLFIDKTKAAQEGDEEYVPTEQVDGHKKAHIFCRFWTETQEIGQKIKADTKYFCHKERKMR